MTHRAQLVLAVFLLATPGSGAGEEPAAAGHRLYHQGLGVDGTPVTATITGPAGGPGVAFPGTAMACARCHGADGRGRPEGGVSPSRLTWDSLTRPYPVIHPSGRRHGPYDAEKLIRAVTAGLDPAGNALHIAMPRFQLSAADAAALVAYLRTLSPPADPGVEDDRLILGTLQPLAGPQGSDARAAQEILEAWIAAVNREGGLYRRRLELRLVAAPEEPAARRQALDRLLVELPVFAWILPEAASNAALEARAAELGIPLLLAVATEKDSIHRRTLATIKTLTQALEHAGRDLRREALLGR